MGENATSTLPGRKAGDEDSPTPLKRLDQAFLNQPFPFLIDRSSEELLSHYSVEMDKRELGRNE
jgi:hypothetical protein